MVWMVEVRTKTCAECLLCHQNCVFKINNLRWRGGEERRWRGGKGGETDIAPAHFRQSMQSGRGFVSGGKMGESNQTHGRGSFPWVWGLCRSVGRSCKVDSTSPSCRRRRELRVENNLANRVLSGSAQGWLSISDRPPPPVVHRTL